MDGKGRWGTKGRVRLINMELVARSGLEHAAEVWLPGGKRVLRNRLETACTGWEGNCWKLVEQW